MHVASAISRPSWHVGVARVPCLGAFQGPHSVSTQVDVARVPYCAIPRPSWHVGAARVPCLSAFQGPHSVSTQVDVARGSGSYLLTLMLGQRTPGICM